MSLGATLPVGPLGRVLALGITLVLVLLLWFAAIAPLVGWYRDGAELLAQRQAYAQRMAELAAQLPQLRQRAAAFGAAGPAPASVLGGETDAIAGARLQEIVQELAGRGGITLTSTEALPAVQTGRYRRIGLRISFMAPFPVLVRLLQAIGQGGSASGAPQMLVDDLEVQASRLMNQPVDPALDARLTVLAFRLGTAPAP